MDLSIGDPWLLMTSFGFVGSAGLLVYLVRQLNAASEDDEEPEPMDEAPTAPAPVMKAELKIAAPKPSMAAARPDTKVAAADMLTEVVGPSKRAPEPAPAPAAAAAATDTGKAGRSPSEISPAVAFIKALHEDIQTFHWEIQGIKKKLDHFEQNQQKQMEFLMEKLENLQREAPAPKPPPPSSPPPSPFQ